MFLPKPSPPIRGVLLKLLAVLTSIGFLRNLLLGKVKRDSGIPQLPEGK